MKIQWINSEEAIQKLQMIKSPLLAKCGGFHPRKMNKGKWLEEDRRAILAYLCGKVRIQLRSRV